jgi:predicted dehydrogenase
MENLGTLGVEDLVLYRTGAGQDRRAAPHPVESRLEDALARRPRAVVIANPTALHMPVAIAAAEAGAHILLEKPISHDLNGVAELRRLTEARGIVVLVGYQFRHDPGLQAIQRWIAEGRLGQVVSASVRYAEWLPGWHPKEDYRLGYSARRELGGGPVLTLSHPLDYLPWLLGRVRSVSASVARTSALEVDTEHAASITLCFESGVLGHVYLDYLQRPSEHHLQIVGTLGQVRWDAGDHVARLFDAERGAWECASPPVGFDRSRLFREEMRHFVACVDGLEQPACSLEDGERALVLGLAALRSAREGRNVDV